MISDIKQIIRSSLMSFKERLKSISENSKVCNIILAVIVVLQIMVVSYYFIFEKEGYHSDEVWSYGLANSFYEPFIYGDTLSQDVSKCHKWVDGSDFLHYLTVQKGEQFRYDSVWYNQSIDMHPPLYFTLLHTISSFFPDTFSKWFGYVINIAAMAVGQVFLYKLGRTASKSKVFGLLLCVMWGFSCGFINLNVFVRMYSLVTMFGILYLYYHCRLYYGEGTVKSNLIKIGIFAFLGALTHHYFLVAAFGIAACYCFYYLFKKQFRMMFAYALTMLGSIGLSIAVFPATIHHLFFMENTESRLATKMPLIHSFRSCASIVLNAITGISISPFATSWYSYVVVAVVLLAAVCIPLGFLFRKEEWFKKAMGKAGDAWKYVINNIDLDFNLEFISKVNEFVARNESIEWGKLRNGKVEITGTSYIPEIPKEENVKNDIAKILEIENTTERAIEYMLYGMRNQLFWDGNKRTSTICANKIMIQNGNGIIKIPDDKLQEFTTLLSDFYTTNEKEKIKQFIFDNCIDGIVFDN